MIKSIFECLKEGGNMNNNQKAIIITVGLLIVAAVVAPMAVSWMSHSAQFASFLVWSGSFMWKG
jgi:hypothetical protein